LLKPKKNLKAKTTNCFKNLDFPALVYEHLSKTKANANHVSLAAFCMMLARHWVYTTDNCKMHNMQA